VSSFSRAARAGSAIAVVTIAFAARYDWALASGASTADAEPGHVGESVLLVLTLAVGFVLVLGLITKMLDLRLRRDGEVVAVKGVISDALGGDPELFELPLTTTVRVPLLRGSPVTIKVFGEVPSDEIRQIALDRVKRTAAAELSVRARIKARIGVSTRRSKPPLKTRRSG